MPYTSTDAVKKLGFCGFYEYSSGFELISRKISKKSRAMEV
jgi:hypothetical protein